MFFLLRHARLNIKYRVPDIPTAGIPTAKDTGKYISDIISVIKNRFLKLYF
jgi:hypothetical protein